MEHSSPWRRCPTPGLAATARAVEQAGGSGVAVEMDVRDADAVRRLVDGTIERFGRLDFLLANAGLADQELASEGDPVVWQRLIETNLLGAMYACVSRCRTCSVRAPGTSC